jgi:hypothetical protein
MVKIQLIDNNEGYLDVDINSVVPLNLGVAEIRDLSKKKGAYSKTITLSGTKNNNRLLNNYFEVNIVSGEFNVSKKQNCIVLQDGVVVLDNCVLQLLNVKITKGLISYEVSIKDTSSDFFSIINGRELTDLDFTDLDHVVSAANIIATFTNTDGYKYGLGNNPTNAYNVNQMMPCLFVKTIFDRIFQVSGYTYSFDESASVGFDKLLLPYTGDGAGLFDVEVKRAQANRLTPIAFSSSASLGSINGILQQIIVDNELIDNGNNYNPTTGVYTSPFDLTGSNALNVSVKLSYEVILETPATAVLTVQSKEIKPQFVAVNQGQHNFLTDSPITIPVGYTFNTSAVVHTGQIVGTIPINTANSGNNISTKIGLEVLGFLNLGVFTNGSGTPVNITSKINITYIEVTFVPSLVSIVPGSTVKAKGLLPTKIKQSDFIKSLAQMFNIFIDTDKTNSRNLILKTRDKYYDEGASKDWSKKIAKDKEQQISFLSDVSNKKYLLTYKPDNDQYNNLYKTSVNETYGQVEYTFDSEFVKDTQTNELIFSPTPIVETLFGAVVPSLTYPAPKLNSRILFDGGVYSCGTYTINGVASDTYPLISHFNNPSLPTYDINFGVCDFYFIQGLGLTANNLYNLYWRRTLGQINNGKLLSALFNLDEVDINTIDLSDKIYIGNTVWNINKIIDYDASSRELTRVELISVDEESSFIPFLTGEPNEVDPNSLNIDIVDTSNVGNGVIQGSNNQTSTNGVTIGNGNVNQGGSVIVGNDNTIQSTSVVLGSGNVVPPQLDNVLIVGNGVNATNSNTVYTEFINNVPALNLDLWEKTTAVNYSFFNVDKSHSIDVLSLASAIIGGNNCSISNVNNATILGCRNLTALYEGTSYIEDLYRNTQRSVTTTDATTTTLHSFTPINGVYVVEAYVTAIEPTTGNSFGATVFATFKVIAGVVTQVNTTSADIKSDFPLAVTVVLDTDATIIRIRVIGQIASTINWRGTINIVK